MLLLASFTDEEAEARESAVPAPAAAPGLCSLQQSLPEEWEWRLCADADCDGRAEKAVRMGAAPKPPFLWDPESQTTKTLLLPVSV